MFVARDYDVSLRVKIHSYFAAVFGRKDLLRKFCSDSGVDPKSTQGHKYCLPEKYMIAHREISYLSDVRDKLILNFYDDYRNAQRNNLSEQESLRIKVENQSDIIEQLKLRLQKNQRALKSAKMSIDIIAFQSAVASMKARIQNEKNEKKALEKRLNAKKVEYNVNARNWSSQVNILEKALDRRRKAFEKNISKYIRRDLNYVDFCSIFDEYPKEVKKVLDGGLYE